MALIEKPFDSEGSDVFVMVRDKPLKAQGKNAFRGLSFSSAGALFRSLPAETLFRKSVPVLFLFFVKPLLPVLPKYNRVLLKLSGESLMGDAPMVWT